LSRTVGSDQVGDFRFQDSDFRNAGLPAGQTSALLSASSGQTGFMNLSRFSVKCLAWLVGFFGGSMALGGLVVLGLFAFGTLPEGITHTNRSLAIGFLALVALFGGLGYYFLRMAWKHLRTPDLNSATTVTGTFSFMLGLWLLTLLGPKTRWPKLAGSDAPTIYLALEVAIIVSCYLFYRLVLKRLAARAFPSDAAAPASAA